MPAIPDDNRPLTQSERAHYREVLQERDLLDQFIGLTLLHSGLKGPTLAHMRSDWKSRQNDRLEIFVPGYEFECDIGGRTGTYRTSWGQGDRPCTECAHDRDGMYQVQLAPRRIPIADEETADVVEKWFTIHDRVVAPSTVYDRLLKLQEATGIDRLNVTVLRHTFGVILVEKGFDWEPILSLLGYKDSEHMASLPRRYGQYVEGFNPFLCGAETQEGERCRNETANREARCQYHRNGQYLCGAENRKGKPCSRTVDAPDVHCVFHRDE